MGVGAGVRAVSEGNEIVWMSASEPLVLSSATYWSPRRMTGWLTGVAASPKSARSWPLSRRPTSVVPPASSAPVFASVLTQDRPRFMSGTESIATCVPSRFWPAGAGWKPKGKPVEPAIVLSLLTAWNFWMQQEVLCGLTPHVSVRFVRLANAGPAGAPLPVAIVVITPVCRSSMSSVRSDGTGMSPLSLGRSRVRIHTR
jgi:hypothetical protein